MIMPTTPSTLQPPPQKSKGHIEQKKGRIQLHKPRNGSAQTGRAGEGKGGWGGEGRQGVGKWGGGGGGAGSFDCACLARAVADISTAPGPNQCLRPP